MKGCATVYDGCNFFLFNYNLKLKINIMNKTFSVFFTIECENKRSVYFACSKTSHEIVINSPGRLVEFLARDGHMQRNARLFDVLKDSRNWDDIYDSCIQ